MTACVIAHGLSLAGTPACMLMALLTAWRDSVATPVVCGTLPSSPIVGGMTPMFVLMAVLHLAPWLTRRAPT